MLLLKEAKKAVVAVDVRATLAETARAMAERNVGAVVVLDGEKPVGIVTDRDIVVRAVAHGVSPDGRVDSVMTPDVVTLDVEASSEVALTIFRSHAFRRIPITEGGRRAGMISTDDMLVSLTDDLSDIVRPIVGEVVFGHAEPAELTIT